MRFLRRHRYVLIFLAVLVLADVMVLNQFMANQSGHYQRREDFILLHDREYKPEAAHLYQELVQELPRLSDKTLLDDLERTRLLVDPKVQDTDNLVWKYYWSVHNRLQKRSERRLARVLNQEAKD